MFILKVKEGRARQGALETPHGVIETPVFMSVGTAAAIRGGCSTDDLVEVGSPVELSNTYHLHMQPGEELIARLGGLHKFMHWERPILTDSGGFQVFSLRNLRKIKEEGAYFTSYLDGRRIFMGPEESMQIQCALGSDIAMAFDECIENPSPRDYVEKSVARTTRWLRRCKDEHERLCSQPGAVNPGQLLFGINQGGTYDDIRAEHMREIAKLDLNGYAIGGLSVGESAEEMYRIIDAVEPFMPADKPRYLMGVGTPLNLLEGVYRGVDFFDCVLPLRNAQHGNVFTWGGKIRILAEKFKYDPSPIDEGCGCPACRSYSKAYIRHLLKADERLGMRLCVLHNLHFYNELMAKIRAEIERGAFTEFYGYYREILDKQL